MMPDLERLRQSPLYAGLTDRDILRIWYKLREVPVEVLLEEVKERGLVVELHVFDIGPAIGIER